MSQEYTMIFEQHLDADGNVMETKAVHPKTLEHQAKAREGQSYQPSKMPPKDLVHVKGERTADGEFIVTDIRRSGTTSTKLAQNLYGDSPEMAELSSDEKEQMFEGYASPEQVEIEGRTFTVGGPLSGEITNLDKASSDEALRLVTDAEKNMGLSLHMEHNTIEALRQSEVQARMARNAAPEQVSTQALYLARDAKTGKTFASVNEPEAGSVDRMTKIQLGKDDMGRSIVTEFELDKTSKNFYQEAQEAGKYPKGDLGRVGVVQGSLNIREGEPLLINNQQLDSLRASNPEAYERRCDLLNEVSGVYAELTSEKLRTHTQHVQDLEQAPERMAAHQKRMADQGLDMGR